MRLQSVRPKAIVKIVAEAKYPPCPGLAHREGQTLQRLAAVIRWQHLAAPCKVARLFEMQICHQQRRLARPIERATLHQPQFLPAEFKCRIERNGNHGFPLPQTDSLGKGRK